MGAVRAGRDAAAIGDCDEQLEVNQIETHGTLHNPHGEEAPLRRLEP
jgi:hypothetical protein